MDSEDQEKVYVAVGNDLQDGFKTLDGTLRKWKSPLLFFVSPLTFPRILFASHLPASSVSYKKLEVVTKYEEGKIHNFPANCIAFYATVKVWNFNFNLLLLIVFLVLLFSCCWTLGRVPIVDCLITQFSPYEDAIASK